MPVIPRALILDYGGVLSHLPRSDARASMAEHLDVELEEFTRAYWADRAEYDRGSSADVYWRQVLDRSGDRSSLRRR